jgi:phosphohistidine phosphatase
MAVSTHRVRSVHIYMRHSKSAYPPGVGDFDRPLSGRGQRNARAAALWFLSQRIKPDVACVSGSRRTRETWEIIGRDLDCRVCFIDELYLADAERIAHTVKQQDGTSVLIIAHHPGIQEAAEIDGGQHLERFPTSAIAVCVDGALTDFVIPR